MKITRSDNGNFRTVDFPYGIGLLMLPVALLLFGGLIAQFSRGAPWREWLSTLSGVAVIVVGGALSLERSAFEFDLLNRKVTWSRRSIFANRGGIVPFDEIKYAVVQFSGFKSAHGRRHGDYRVALSTATGIIPLTESYGAGKVSDERCRELRAMINEALGVSLASESDNDILEMARINERLWADCFARARLGLGATDATTAKQYVDDLIAKSARSSIDVNRDETLAL